MILDPADKESATDATLATHSENGDGQNGPMDNGNITSDSAQPSTKVNPQSKVGAAATRIEPIIEHPKQEYDKAPSTDMTFNNIL